MSSSQCAVETDSKTDNTDRLPSPTTAAEFQVPSPTLFSFEVIAPEFRVATFLDIFLLEFLLLSTLLLLIIRNYKQTV